MATSSMSMAAAAALEAMIKVLMRCEREDGSKWETTDECVTVGSVGVYQD